MPGTAQGLSSVVQRESLDGESDCTIAIIGAGFSGTMMAIHLRHALPAGARILLIERSGTFARGVAYAQTSAPHLLNVRAANMSAFPNDPGHFERWIKNCPQGAKDDVHQTEAGQFATRRLYGRYLQETLRETLCESPEGVELFTGEVERLERSGSRWRLHYNGGLNIEAAGVVLACGNLPPEQPCDGVVFHNPWAAETLRDLNDSDPVLIVGTGLTMVDLVLELQSSGFKGQIVALSRRGLLPQPHASVDKPWPAPHFSAKERSSALALLRSIRTQIRLAAMQGIGWRAVIDSLRPITTELWHGLPPCEQERFMRHPRPYWDIHRHRMAPSSTASIQALRKQNRLRILRGRISDITPSSGGQAEVSIINRVSGHAESIRVQRIIHATGLQAARSNNGLLADLLQTGLARLDGLELGLEVNNKLNVLDAAGKPVSRLWALGPLVRGVFWECLAVPDIRIQAQELSAEITAQAQE